MSLWQPPSEQLECVSHPPPITMKLSRGQDEERARPPRHAPRYPNPEPSVGVSRRLEGQTRRQRTERLQAPLEIALS